MTKDRAIDLLGQIKAGKIHSNNMTENEDYYIDDLWSCMPNLSRIEVLEKIAKEDIGL